MERFMFGTFFRNIYYMERPMDRFSPTADTEAKEKFFNWKATAGCLAGIMGSLRTHPHNGVQGLWLWASDFD